MRERFAGCLKKRGRDALRACIYPLCTSRHLHSTFWSHGAGNIKLPAWWILFLQTTELHYGGQHRAKSTVRYEGFNHKIRSIFFDFLYPTRTRALVERLNQSTTAHRQATELARQQLRGFTSIAQDLIDGKVEQEDHSYQEREVSHEPLSDPETEQKSNHDDGHADRTADMDSRTSVDDLVQRLNFILAADKSGDSEILWTTYKALGDLSERHRYSYLDRVFFRLTYSRDKMALEHALELFESVDQSQLRKKHFTMAIIAAMRAHNVQMALVQVRDIFERSPTGTGYHISLIFDIAVAERAWPVAIDIWHRFWHSPLLYHISEHDLWKNIKDRSAVELAPLANDATKYAQTVQETSNEDDSYMIEEFVMKLTEYVLRPGKPPTDPTVYNSFLDNLRKLVGYKAVRFLEAAMYQLLDVGDPAYDREAVTIYEILREVSSYSPSLLTLNEALKICGSFKNVAGSVKVLEDFQRHEYPLSTMNCVSLAELFAHAGELDLLKTNFQAFWLVFESSDDGSLALQKQRLFNSMLYVHFKRGDVTAIQHQFEQLQSEYGFRPNWISYNYMIMAFAAANDETGALRWFSEMRQQAIPPDVITYATIMSLFAGKGDKKTVYSWLDEFNASGLELEVPIVDAVILANIAADRRSVAERLVKKVTTMHLKGDLTYMWNMLLESFAVKEDATKVFQLHKEMQKAMVPENERTFAAIIMALCLSDQTDAAFDMLKHILPQMNVPRTPLHYALIMSGYINAQRPWDVKLVYNHMLQKKIQPDVFVYEALIRAAAADDQSNQEEFEQKLSAAQKAFESAVPAISGSDFAVNTGPTRTKGMTAKEAFFTLPFAYMISLYGKAGMFQKASDLFNRYLDTATDLGHESIASQPPMVIITALMATYRRASNGDEMEKCWSLALEKVQESCQRKYHRDDWGTGEGGWALPSRRFDLNRPLEQYMWFLADQGRIDDLIDVVDRIRRAGFDLQSNTWNIYIESLASSSNISHQFLAYKLCEKELLNEWPGWQSFSRKARRLKAYFQDKYNHCLLRRGHRFPEYSLFVRLAAVYVDARSGDWVPKGTLSRRMLEEIAPDTVKAVREMPRILDETQLLLRDQ